MGEADPHALEVQLREENALLRRRVEHLARVVAATADYVYSVKLEAGRPVEAEHGGGCLALTGYSSEELKADPALWLRMVLPEDRPRVEARARRLDAGEDCPPVEYRIRRKDGSLRWVSNSAVVQRAPDGRVLGLDGFARDITERKAAEEALRQEHDLLLRIADTSPVAITVLDPEGRLTFCNATAERVLGVTRDEATQRSFRAPEWRISSVDGGPFPESELPFNRVRETLQPVRGVRHAIESGDGRRLLLSINAAPILDASGKLEGVVATIEDITQQSLAARALADSERRAANLVEASPMGVHMYELRADGRLVFMGANPAADRLLGVDNSQFVGKTIEEAFPPLQATEVPDRYRRAAAAGESWFTEHVRYSHGRIDGAYEVYAFQTTPGSMAAFFLDITGRLRARQEKEELEAQLRQQQKLESIGTLAAGVAHEINNPLNGILNYAQLILNRAPQDETVGRFAGNILHESERVSEIVRNLLTFSRQDRQSHSPARMQDIVAATLSLVRGLFRRDQITVTADVPDELPAIKCRSQQIQQVLLNLLTNARDASNERYPGADPLKVIRVESRLVERDGRRWLRTVVADAGSGVPAELRERIFDPFFTTKPREQGTGLGLSVSYGIVRAHHGELSFESEPAGGTRFALELPVDNGWSIEAEGGSRGDP